MRYLLSAALIFVFIAYLTYRWAQHQNDNYGAVVFVGFSVIVSVVVVIAYFVVALWSHKFW